MLSTYTQPPPVARTRALVVIRLVFRLQIHVAPFLRACSIHHFCQVIRTVWTSIHRKVQFRGNRQGLAIWNPDSCLPSAMRVLPVIAELVQSQTQRQNSRCHCPQEFPRMDHWRTCRISTVPQGRTHRSLQTNRTLEIIVQ